MHGDEIVWDEFVGDELLGDESSRIRLTTGVKVARSVIGTKGGDLQYPDIYKLLLSLTHGSR